MSDEFDKEAEREKLREKFAKDEKKREHTQRMSELLLQGATMTNRHCETCGDPIFRHDGQAFCPTCHATEDGYEVPVSAPGEDGEAGGAGEASETAGVAETAEAGEAAGTAKTAEATETTDKSPTQSAHAPTNATAETKRTDKTANTADPATAANTADPATTPPPRDLTDTGRQPNASDDGRPASGTAHTERARETSTPDELSAAREAVCETLTRFAQAAAATDDPRRARERLETVEQAATTLATLDR